MSGLLPLLSAAEMRRLDERAQAELGMRGIVLMERAGVGAAAELRARHPDASRVVVLCGTGNNGGDGAVVARELHGAGVRASIHLTGAVGRARGDARANLEIAARSGVPIAEEVTRPGLRRALRSADVVVDAVFGTGFAGAPRAPVDGLLETLNAAGVPVVALDVPSGVDASSGTVAGAAVRADLTVSFHAAKVGLLVAPGRAQSGDVVVLPIGIPAQLETPPAVSLATARLLDQVPRKRATSTKYSAGSVLVVGGASGYPGAPLLASLAALRAGAGIVWTAVPPDVARALAARQPELIVRELPGGLDAAERAGAVALGPGLGREPDAVELARRIALEHHGPLVIDADGLFAFAGNLEALAQRRVATVLTPHEGEMARLLGEQAGWVRANRLEAVRRAAAASRTTVLLKGADTLVAEPGGERVVVCSSDVPGLATAGTGDVLTGAVAAMLAKGLAGPLAAACAAVAHGRAGALAAARRGPDGIIAGDVIDALPVALAPDD